MASPAVSESTEGDGGMVPVGSGGDAPPLPSPEVADEEVHVQLVLLTLTFDTSF